MHLFIDGYNLLHAGRLPTALTAEDLGRERDRLIDQLSRYRQTRPCEITVVFDGWQGGWAAEKKERKKGIEMIFSMLGEKADEVIKRFLREKGAGAVVITSDRDISRYAERMNAAVIPSDQFKRRIEMPALTMDKGFEEDHDEGKGAKTKGPSRRLSKKERRTRAALKKL
jgi:uncharacterized protein